MIAKYKLKKKNHTQFNTTNFKIIVGQLTTAGLDWCS